MRLRPDDGDQIMFVTYRLVAWAVTVTAVLGAVSYGVHDVHQRGYLAGQAERTAFYQPMIIQAQQAALRADQKSQRLDQQAATITAAIEAQHVDTEQVLTARAARAEQQLAQLLRQRATVSGPAGGGPVPQVPGGAAGTAPTGGGRGRDDELARRLSDLGARCERDAARLTGWQDWYVRERAALSGGPFLGTRTVPPGQ